MFTCFKVFTLSVAACLALAQSTHADGFSLGFSTHGRHGDLGVSWSRECARPARPHACSACGSIRARRTWIPARYGIEQRREWVEGRIERVWIEPVFEVRYDSCGKPFKFCVAGGHYASRRTGGHYETRDVRVWQPGHWAAICASCG